MSININDVNWEELDAKLPWEKTEEDRQERIKQWKRMDNGNGYLSLSEVDIGTRDVLKLAQMFEMKPVLKRAFFTAKNKMKSKNSLSDDYVTKGEYRWLLKYLRQYYEYWLAFAEIDTSGDRRLSYEEFIQAKDLLEGWGVDMSDPQAQWKECDSDQGGMVLFDEFCEWAINKNLNLEEDDDEDEDDKPMPPAVSLPPKKKINLTVKIAPPKGETDRKPLIVKPKPKPAPPKKEKPKPKAPMANAGTPQTEGEKKNCMAQFVHPSTKFPWLILVMSILTGGSMEMNSYQAQGGVCMKTFFLGFGIEMFAVLCWWTILIPLCCWAFMIYHGYLVMKASK